MKRVSALLLCMALVLCGCTYSAQRLFSQTYLEYFDTVTVIYGYEKDKATFDENCEKIAEQISEYHKLFDIYHTYQGITNLCTLNQTAPIEAVVCDEKICDLLLYAKEAYSLTQGKVNIAMGSVLSVWHTYRTQAQNGLTPALPTDEELRLSAQHTDIENLIVDRAASTVRYADPDMRIDVGAVAKGYTAERIAQWMADAGLTNYTLNLGGNIRTLGHKPNGDAWICGIQDPDSDNTLYHVALDGQTLVTSGDYQRYYTVDGVRYHHIIDPDTRYPLSTFRSVSVLSGDSALADVLSTGLFNLPLEQGMALLENMEGTEALWILSDGTVSMTDGFRTHLSNTKGTSSPLHL